MHPVFIATGAAPAIPIWFVTGATWPALRVALEPGARGFVDAAGFEPKPGRPEGGECQAARALYALLAARYR
jgi:hypothetical protein